jgi:cation transport ATPase
VPGVDKVAVSLTHEQALVEYDPAIARPEDLLKSLRGIIGLAFAPPGYPTADFFSVSVMVATYHIFSEWLSLIVKTRSSQAVKRLLDLQPETARIERDGCEIELPIAQVKVRDRVARQTRRAHSVDGAIVSGRSSVDQSLVTGESAPVIGKLAIP